MPTFALVKASISPAESSEPTQKWALGLLNGLYGEQGNIFLPPVLMHPVLKWIQAQPWHASKVQSESKLSPGLCRSHYLSNHSLSLFFLLLIQFSLGNQLTIMEKCSCPYPWEKIRTKQCLLLKLKAEHIWGTEGDFSLIHTCQANIKCFWARIGSKHLPCGCFKIVHMVDEESFRWPAS